ncbi:MAG: hypothetical protein U0V56_05380 [Actinomycetota bacterium]
MPLRDHSPSGRRLHLPIVGVTNGPGPERAGVSARGERKPPWLKVRLSAGPNVTELRELMRTRSLHTVCEEAMCPNLGECWEQREATFLILGDQCTKAMRLLRRDDGQTGSGRRGRAGSDRRGRRGDGSSARRDHRGRARRPARRGRPDLGTDGPRGPRRGTRLPHRGASERPEGRRARPRDGPGGGPDVFAHNLETVRRLHPRIRPAFGYDRSLGVLRLAKAPAPGRDREPDPRHGRAPGRGARPALRDLRDADATW